MNSSESERVVDAREVLPRGTLLGAKYSVAEVLGAGGFGITYLAFDQSLHIHVAIKEYFPAQLAVRDTSKTIVPRSRSAVEMFDRLRTSFVREGRVLAKFDHAAIVKIQNVFEENGTAYMVMALERGASLKNWLADLGRPPTQDELDRLVMPLLDALELIHNARFLHRDIAPDNIIVRSDGSPVLIDFGASRYVAAGMTATVTGIVKEGFSPIEQYSADSRSQGPWTDIYALGATMYKAVTGRVPQDASSRVINDDTPSCREAEGYREPFLDAIDAAIAVQPSDRPQSIAAWRPMLEARDAAGFTISARGRQPKGRTASHRRGIAWIAAAFLLAIVASVAMQLGAGLDTAAPPTAPSTPGPTAAMAEQESRRHAAARSTDTVEGYERFLAEFPQARDATAIRLRIGELNKEAATRAEAEARLAQRARQQLKLAEEDAAWRAIAASSEAWRFKAFLASHPDGAHTGAARTRLIEIEAQAVREQERRQAQEAQRLALRARDETAWQVALSLGTMDAVQSYLTLHPDGAFVTEAQSRLAALSAAAERLRLVRAQEALLSQIGDELVRLDCIAIKPVLWDEEARSAIGRVNQTANVTLRTDQPDIATLGSLKALPDGHCRRKRDEEIAQIVVALQNELRRVGCLVASAGKTWDEVTRAALARFNSEGNYALATDRPSNDALLVLRAVKKAVCLPPAPVAKPREPPPRKPKAKAESRPKPPSAAPAQRKSNDRARAEPARRNCRLESLSECRWRVCPGGGCGLKGSGICKPGRRRQVCN